nr:hypothetical protein [Burkholderia sp. Ax-1720]
MLTGLGYGLLLFMLSAGLTLIFSLLGVLNFAHASFYLLGAYFGVLLAARLDPWAAFVLAPLLVGGLGALVERLLLRRVRAQGHLGEMLLTFGLAYLIAEGAKLAWGAAPLAATVPAGLDGTWFTLYGAAFPRYRGFVMLVSVAMLLALGLLLRVSQTGRIVRAALTHRAAVEALGHDVPRLTTLVFAAGTALAALAGAAPLRASGRNIEIWLPHEARTGERSRLWMKLQNEVQMAWFGHAVNETREARGQFTANSIWFHGQGRLRPVSSPFARVLSTDCATRGLALAAQVPVDAPPAAFAALAGAPGEDEAARATLLELDALTVPFIQQDWAAWREALDTLERDWFAPALEALRAGVLRELSFTLCGDTGATTLAVTRGDLRKFWRRRALASLFE